MNRKHTAIAVGLLALAAAGSAMANTSIANGETGNGSIFVNVVDATNSTSFVFDTGLKLNSFTGTSSLSFNLGSDANWQSFVSGAGASDSTQFNVVGVNAQGSTNTYNAAFTSNAALGTQVGRVGSTSNSQLQAAAALNDFINAINGSTSSTTSSLYVQDTGANANDAAYFGSSFSMGSGFAPPGSGISTLKDLGTAQKFYKLGLNGDGSTGGLKALVTTYAGVWNLAGGFLTYTVSEVPLPDSLGLLLAGLALMGLIARRSKGSGMGDNLMGSAAA